MATATMTRADMDRMRSDPNSLYNNPSITAWRTVHDPNSSDSDVQSALARYQSSLGGQNDNGELNQLTLEGQLRSIQSDVNVRNQALTDLVSHYPDIVAMNLHQISQELGPEYDASDQLVMKNAADQLGAYYQARSGGYSSGAFNEAVAKEGADLATGRRNTFMGMADQAWQQRYTEAASQRNFQRTMLGQVNQNLFDWNKMMAQFQQEDKVNQEQLDNLSSSRWSNALGGAAGAATTFGLYRLAGPAGAAAGTVANGSRLTPATNPYGNDASTGGFPIG